MSRHIPYFGGITLSSVMDLKSVKDTTLWKRLKTDFADGEHAETAEVFAANLPGICQEASERMKAFPSLHPEYTSHDQTHLLRVTEIMARIMSDSVIATLNPVEIALLILSAHFHDQGMVLDADELEDIKGDADFSIFQRNWEIEHPNMREVRERQRAKYLSEDERARCRGVEQELLAGLLTEYIRQTHGKRSADFVRDRYGGDKRWECGGRNLAPLVAELCHSHVGPTELIAPANGFHYDEGVGPCQVNLVYLALVLRLADILDFDRERTPDSLYRTIHFTNDVSLQEWMKHRSVEGWTISGDMIRYTLACQHPIYERTARQLMDMIDHELAAAHDVVRGFPQGFESYVLHVPLKVDRSRIGPEADTYIYHDLEFSLSRDEIVKLLMADNLYSSPSLCVRELLQNSMDVLRHRKAIRKRDMGIDWTGGKVVMEHILDDRGREIVRCNDNGVGMDKDIIKRFLTKVGRSYYRSPEFERERVTFREVGVDFDPCAQFGIGIMSCFMLGDQITIRTRRDRGCDGQGDPVIVEIDGLGGLVVFREGPPDQPVGTTVEIVCRERQPIFREWDDKVRLTTVLDGYALACEFPIEGRCTIPEIEDEIHIAPGIAVRETYMESLGIEACTTLEQSLAEIAPELSGVVRASFLLDEEGQLTTGNSQAQWVPPEKHNAELQPANGQDRDKYMPEYNPLCLDGILVCGRPGRQRDCFLLGTVSNNFVYLGRDRFVLDVRGALKPPLTPGRVPATRSMAPHPLWQRLSDLASLAHGKLWERVAKRPEVVADPELFWQLALIHQAWIPWMRAGAIWQLLRVPVCSTVGEIEWRQISSLGRLKVVEVDEQSALTTEAGATLGAHQGLLAWASEEDRQNQSIPCITETVVGMCTVVVGGGSLPLQVREPDNPDVSPSEFQLSVGPFLGTRLLPYAGQLSDFLSVELPLHTANRAHPLCKLAHESKYREQRSEIEQFAHAAVRCLSHPEIMPHATKPGASIVDSLRHLGHLYQSVDWTSVASELAPPYKIWLEEGPAEITAGDFERWAEIKPEDQ